MEITKEEESFELFVENIWSKVNKAEMFIDDSIARFETLEDIIAEILGNFSDHDTLVSENKVMAKFIESQGFDVDDVIFFNGNLDKVIDKRFNK